MQVRIHHYAASHVPDDELRRSGRHMLAAIELIPGFVAFVLLDLGAGRLASVCICDEDDALNAVDAAASDWIDQVGLTGDSIDVATGEIMLQRGL